jgi:hypothetical protein
MGDNKVYAFSPTVLLIFYILRYGYIIKILFKSKKSKLLIEGYLYLFKLVILLFFFVLLRVLLYFTKIK